MQIDITQDRNTTIARVTGEVDMANATQFADEVLGKMGDEATALVIDLTDLRYIDSAGVRSLFEIASTLKMRDSFFAIAVLEDSPLRSVLKVTRVEDVATLSPTRTAALELARVASDA